ncbi:uncharacterized protein LOC127565320 [Drosophila albomicans]|uniref:Uncharacterized protein LOC127565320 n=1 Tax=Drosophila albomicans TaxID=7291 RepID=A0A9C6SUH4_DROAB|nr:uncharacterized protein LOC127565320 [Drosophila albomicans]
MKFKYQSKHKSLLLFKFKSIKHIARVVARALAKSFFYLGAPPICPRHQLSLLSLYPHCPYIGYCLCYPISSSTSSGHRYAGHSVLCAL